MIDNKLLQFTQLLASPAFTTPAEITNECTTFCESIGTASIPFFMRVTPQPWARMGSCEYNVEEMIQRRGGSIVFGYRIWSLGNLYFEAQPHAIWEAPDRRLVDITFSDDGEKRVLFLKDDRLTTVKLTRGDQRHTMAFDPEIHLILRKLNAIGSMIEIRSFTKEESWKRMPTYQEWLKNR